MIDPLKRVDTQALIESMRQSLNGLERDIADFNRPHKMTLEEWLDFCRHDWEMIE